MRIVTKINSALGILVGLSVLLNFAALQFTVKPSFAELEEKTASDNQTRVLEALHRLEDRARGSARDYAVWDDTYSFMSGKQPEYLDKNINAETLRPLNANFFVIVDNSGKIVVNEGFEFSADDASPAHLFPVTQIALEQDLLQSIGGGEPGAGLLRTEHGLVAVGYAPILKSDSTGPSPGILLIGSIIDVDPLINSTKVEFRVGPPSADVHATTLASREDVIEVTDVLPGLGNVPAGTLISKTPKSISKLGQQTIWAALGLIVVAGLAALGASTFLLHKIAIARIERMRSHLTQVGATGSLSPMPDDPAKDELSDMSRSFNSMATQLAELRERIRRQDYQEGAADHAAGILHNVRNNLSPIGAIAWSLAQAEDTAWKEQVRRALSEIQAGKVGGDRIGKLQTFVGLAAEKFLAEGDQRKQDLESMRGMLRHLDEVLAAEDAVSQVERVREPIEVEPAIRLAAGLVESRPAARIKVTCPQDVPVVLGSNVNLKQVLGNLFINAAEAIEATGRVSGRIEVRISETIHLGQPALDIAISDDGEGIDEAMLKHIFEKGFSTRRERSGGLGLHWCANAMNGMGGRIHAESGGKGHGATLHLVLPLAAASIADAA